MRAMIAVAIAFLLTLWMSSMLGDTKAELKHTQQELTEVREYYVNLEQQRVVLQQALQTTAEFYQKELKANTDSAANVVAEYTAANKWLSVRLKQATASTASTGTCSDRPVLNDRAELHPETSESLIRITKDADSKVKALQDIIKLLTTKQQE